MNVIHRNRSSHLPAVAALGCAAALLASCARVAPEPEPVRAVKVTVVAPSRLDMAREYPAEVRARTETRLGFRVAGKLLQRQVEVGQRVRSGQVLALLDPQDFQLAAHAAQAQVRSAATQRDLAAADFQRYSALKDQNFISGAELERRDAALRSAQAQLDHAQAQLSLQGNQAAYSTLRAMAAGVVTAVEAEPGQVLAGGAPVVRLALDGERDAVFALPEDRLAQVRIGAPVELRQWSDARAFQGRVREVSASTDPITRTYQVKVAIGGSSPALGSTMTVRMTAATADVAVIKVPSQALRQQGAGSAVWVVEEPAGTVRLQPVKVAGFDGDQVIVESGLQPGMQVVVAGVHVLAPGQKVTLWKDLP